MNLLTRHLRSLLLLVSLLFTSPAFAGAELVMVEEHGCPWCERWNAEISHIYPKTAVGRASPLRRIDINQPVPEDIQIARPLRFTPTFMLVVDGVEKARIEGYPGEDFFWSLYEGLLLQHGIPMDDQTSTN